MVHGLKEVDINLADFVIHRHNLLGDLLGFLAAQVWVVGDDPLLLLRDLEYVIFERS
jgi:hypothetical protein